MRLRSVWAGHAPTLPPGIRRNLLLRAALKQIEDSRGGERHAGDADAAVPECILYRAGDHRRRRDHPALAHALDPELVDGRREVEMVDLERRHVLRTRYWIVHEGAGEELPRLVVDQLLAEGRPDALGE